MILGRALDCSQPFSPRALLPHADDVLRRYSRVVYDCTAALYYGSKTYKTYYRRGIALARLGHSKKAIAGPSLILHIRSSILKLIRCL